MTGSSLTAGLEVALEPASAFSFVTEELTAALRRLGLVFEAAPGGEVVERDVVVGRVVTWEPGALLALEWHPADWEPEEATRVAVHFAPTEAGTRVSLTHDGWGTLIGDPGELASWFAGEVVAPACRATAPARFGDWLTDRLARRPSGALARATYGDPVYHYPHFRVILNELEPGAGDRLLEVGCGGGALLREVLRRGSRAAGVDHSPDMVRLARESNREAVEAGRLEVHEAEADELPFADESFTCAAMSAVLGFLPDATRALGEIRRVLRPGGRLVALGSDPEVQGTMAAPEPMASRLRFYDGDELERLGAKAGFTTVRVVRRSLEAHARDVGVPDEHLELFAGEGPRFLIAAR